MFTPMSRFILVGLAFALATGCSPAPLSSHASPGDATLRVIPQVLGGGYATQAEIKPYTADAVAQITVTLALVGETGETPVAETDVSKADLGKALVFDQLKPETRYRILARAYKAAGGDPSDLISHDASSSLVIDIGRDDAHTVTIPVQLVDRTFDGRPQIPGLDIRPGGYQADGSPALVAGTYYETRTVAGGTKGFLDGSGRNAQFDGPHGMTQDTDGNLYVSDRNGAIRKVVPGSWEVTTLAGASGKGYVDGTLEEAKFQTGYALAFDDDGNLFVTDAENHAIRKIDFKAGRVTTVAGGGEAGFRDGTGTDAKFNQPYGLAIDRQGHLYVSDSKNRAIRRIEKGTWEVTTIAGDGNYGNEDGMGMAARFAEPNGLAIDADDNLYVADEKNYLVRKIAHGTWQVSTLAGRRNSSGLIDGPLAIARLDMPTDITLDRNGNVYVTGWGNQAVRKIDTSAGTITTLAGPYPQKGGGFVDGLKWTVRFNFPRGIVVDDDDHIYVADADNHAIRMLSLVR